MAIKQNIMTEAIFSTRGSDSIQLSLDEIRSKAKENRNEERVEESKKRFVRSLTRTRQMSLHTSKNLEKKESV